MFFVGNSRRDLHHEKKLDLSCDGTLEELTMKLANELEVDSELKRSTETDKVEAGVAISVDTRFSEVKLISTQSMEVQEFKVGAPVAIDGLKVKVPRRFLSIIIFCCSHSIYNQHGHDCRLDPI